MVWPRETSVNTIFYNREQQIVGEEVLRRRAELEKIGPDRIAGGKEKSTE